MATTFFIELNLKTVTGFERYGCFDLGDDREFAVELFSRLEGRPDADDQAVLQMDLIEKYRGLPLNLQVINCSMNELCRNIRIITRELFKHKNLDSAPF